MRVVERLACVFRCVPFGLREREAVPAYFHCVAYAGIQVGIVAFAAYSDVFDFDFAFSLVLKLKAIAGVSTESRLMNVTGVRW